MKGKILVIGGAGYIGRHVALALLDNGYEVKIYDNLSKGCKEDFFDKEDCEFILGDIMDEVKLNEVMSKGFQGIVHLAALKDAGKSMIDIEDYAERNLKGSLNVLNAASKNGIKNIVFSSTAAVYGLPKYLPFDEKHPTNPENFYGFTKLEIERFMGWYDKIKNMKFAALRYFNAAGFDVDLRVKGLERDPGNLIPIVMEVATRKRDSLKIYGDDYDTRDGTGVRDYVHVSDLARAHVMAMKHLIDKKESFVVNLASENGLSVKEIIDSVREITGKEIPVEIVARREGDTATVLASAAKARELLGWKAEKSDVDTIVRSTWAVYS